MSIPKRLNFVNEGLRGLAHGSVGFISSGGEPSAFYAGTFSSFAGSLGGLYGGVVLNSDVGGTLFSAGIGGLASEMGGGDFWSGAALGTIGHLVNQVAHVRAVRHIYQNSEGFPYSADMLLFHYLEGSGDDYIISNSEFNRLLEALTATNKDIKNGWQPVVSGFKKIPGLYFRSVSTYGTTFAKAGGTINIYATGDGNIVGMSDYYNMDAQPKPYRPGNAEQWTTFGRILGSLTSKNFMVYFGVTPPSNMILKR